MLENDGQGRARHTAVRRRPDGDPEARREPRLIQHGVDRRWLRLPKLADTLEDERDALLLWVWADMEVGSAPARVIKKAQPSTIF